MRTSVARFGTLLLLGGVAFGFVAPHSAAQESPEPAPPTEPSAETQIGATIDDVGWWNRANAAPALPTGNPPPPPTSVPEDAIGVGAISGDPDKVAAIGILPEEASGTISSFTLALHEVAGDGTINAGGEGVVIAACPITNFWTGTENGRWENRPEVDCARAEIPGTRAEDGTWTWDLTPIGQLWLDGTVAPAGVLLKSVVEAPVSFQVSFNALPDQIGISFATTGAGGPDATSPTTTTTEPASTGDGFGTGSSAAPSGGFSRSGSGEFSGPTFTTPPATQPPPPSGSSEDAGSGASVPQMIRDEDQPSVFGNLPPATLALVPLIAGLAVLVMLTLGKAGEPSLVSREGRVSRRIGTRTT